MSVLRVQGPRDAAAAVVAVLGFVPSSAVVVLPVGGRGRVPQAWRFDLPGSGEEAVDVALGVGAAAERFGVPGFGVVVFGPAQAAEGLARVLRAGQVGEVVDVVAVDVEQDRVRSVWAEEPGPVVLDLAGHPFVAEAVVAGRLAMVDAFGALPPAVSGPPGRP